MPTKLKLDLESNFVKYFTFHAGANFIKWNDVSENLKDQIELTVNSNYILNNLVNINLGLFFTDLNYKTDIINLNESLEALYITAGVYLEYSFVNLGVTIADSHLLSDDWRKQTLLNCNIILSL